MPNSFEDWLKSAAANRFDLAVAATQDIGIQELILERSRRNVQSFFDDLLWTYDPRPEASPNHLPFILWDYQAEFIHRIEAAYQRGRDIRIEKSRDMGVSWLILGWVLWHWRFDEAFNALLGSRKEDLVDNFQMDSLFGKVGYMVEGLPAWALPDKFDVEDHRAHMRLVNPESKNTIQGESANTEFSRQGRYSVIFMDEFAFWPFATSGWTATADSAPVRIVASTPHGKDNKFFELKNMEGIEQVSLPWRLHPKKDVTWYEGEASRRTAREIAQEIDMDYDVSGFERVFPRFRVDDAFRSKVIVDPFDIPFTDKEVNLGKLGPDGKPMIQKVRRYAWRLSGGLDYGIRNVSSFHVHATDQDGNLWTIWEWRKTLADLTEQGWRGSMVQAIAGMLKTECPFYDYLDLIWADPSIWAANVSTPDGMTSLAQQLLDEGIDKLAKGAQDDVAAYERTLTLWSGDEPSWRIFKCCSGLIDELDGLEWDDWSEVQGVKRGLKERMVDKNNHSWDDWKYYIMSRPEPKAQVKVEVPETSAEWFKRRIEETQKQGNRTVLRRYGGDI